MKKPTPTPMPSNGSSVKGVSGAPFSKWYYPLIIITLIVWVAVQIDWNVFK